MYTEEELCKKCNKYRTLSYFIKRDKKTGLKKYKLCKLCRIEAREIAKQRLINITFRKRVQQDELKCLRCGRWKSKDSFTKYYSKNFWIGGYCEKCRKRGFKTKKKKTIQRKGKKHTWKRKDKRKLCSYCKKWKLLRSFKAEKNTKSSWHKYCKSCRVEKSKYRKKFKKGKLVCKICKKWKTVEEFGISIKGFLGRNSACRSCVYIKNRTQRLRLEYGLTTEQYNDMLNHQKGLCAICKSKEVGKGFKYLHIDHNHETGKVRGLLCSKCNRGLSCFGDNSKLLGRARKYLED